MNKSRKIGMVFGCMEILEARTIKIDGKNRSQYCIRCVKCGAERWNNTATVLRGTAKCYQCNPNIRPKTAKGLKKNAPKGLYMSYQSMLIRCYGKTSDRYPYYGGRGISVCKEWRFDYKAFEKWAFENGWKDGKTIDRIDPNGNYEPSNCRWADKLTQANNIRTNIRLTYNGEEMTLAQFCKLTSANYDRARYLIFNKGIAPEKALEMM